MAFVSPVTVKLDPSLRRTSFSSRVQWRRPGRTMIPATRIQTRHCIIKSMAGPPVRTHEADTPKKQFLERLKGLGKVRFVVRNPTGILESMGTFNSLFFASIRSTEYANVVDHSENIDMHLLLSGFTGVRFDVGTSRSKEGGPLYTLRLLGEDKKTPALSLFVMNSDGESVEAERIQAWKDLKKDYVKSESEEVFFFEE